LSLATSREQITKNDIQSTPQEHSMTPGRGHLIGGKWTKGEGPEFSSHDPSTGAVAWTGRGATSAEADAAVAAARKAWGAWADLTVERRTEFLQAFAGNLRANMDALLERISLETGKPRWESRQEVETMIAKVANSLDSHKARATDSTFEQGGFTAALRFRPHGAVAVLGPFNLPGHLPHSHIVPALLAGNTVVYKPSELTPGVGEMTTDLWTQAGLPRGVINLVQGGRDTGATLAGHAGIDGLYFTGSHAAGVALSRLNADRPGRILALELGGNNPLVVWDCGNAEAAALLAVQSAFITSGQRCVCARRLILPEGPEGRRHLDALLALIPRLRVGPPSDQPEPFLGPLITATAADRLLAAQEDLIRRGGKPLVAARKLPRGAAFPSPSPMGPKTNFVSPGVIDMTSVADRPDEEIFGPLLQVIRVPDFDAALEEANRTRFGLAAGLLSDRRELWDRFHRRVRAGVMNWNRQTTGASGRLPFGGVGESGNHRPSAFFAADYCAYPVASLEAEKALAPASLPAGIAPAP
jgi:succinylglutamic semialdehyde dehydrogenase